MLNHLTSNALACQMDEGVGHMAWVPKAQRTKSSRPKGTKAGQKGHQLDVQSSESSLTSCDIIYIILVLLILWLWNLPNQNNYGYVFIFLSEWKKETYFGRMQRRGMCWEMLGNMLEKNNLRANYAQNVSIFTQPYLQLSPFFNSLCRILRRQKPKSLGWDGPQGVAC